MAEMDLRRKMKMMENYTSSEPEIKKKNLGNAETEKWWNMESDL